LHWAALNGHVSAVELLIKAGAEPSVKNDAGRTPVFEAQQRGFEDVVDVFLRRFEEDADREDDRVRMVEADERDG